MEGRDLVGELPKIVCIVGPTASGKSALAVDLAVRFSGEIVSADSMQIYRGMDIGTAKPDAEEMKKVPHHMIDIADIGDEYSVARFAKDAAKAVDGIINRGALPIVVGGTGLYIDALVRGSGFAAGKRDPKLVTELEKIFDESPEKLHKMLEEIDPKSAMKIGINDKKRLIRAIEVYRETGVTISEHNKKTKDMRRYDACIIGICPKERSELYSRINGRVDRMMRDGLEKEVKELYNSGLLKGTAAQAIGYKEMLKYISGDMTLEQAVEDIKLKSRRYAKRQLTWFRKNTDIFWIEYGKEDTIDRISLISSEYLNKCGII